MRKALRGGKGDAVGEAAAAGCREAASFPASSLRLISSRPHWEKGKHSETGGPDGVFRGRALSSALPH